MKMQSYRDLEIYNKAHELGVEIHFFSFKLPSHETYEIGNQIRRSSKSISSNIIEGFGRRRYKAEFIRFLVFAQSSCDETVEWIRYIRDCYPELKKKAEELSKDYELLGRKLNSFIQAVEEKHLS